jgi:hypothetical protein
MKAYESPKSMFPLLPELVQLESNQHLEILYLFSIPTATSTSEALGCGTNGSAVCISVCLTPPAYIQWLPEVILPPIQNFVKIRK